MSSGSCRGGTRPCGGAAGGGLGPARPLLWGRAGQGAASLSASAIVELRDVCAAAAAGGARRGAFGRRAHFGETVVEFRAPGFPSALPARFRVSCIQIP